MRIEWNAGSTMSGILVVVFVFANPHGKYWERRYIPWGRS